MKYRVGLALASNKKMRSLNYQYRQKNIPTDVLSFNLNEALKKDEYYLGDVVISLEMAKKRAGDKNISLDKAFGELVEHGARHLLGWEHD